MDFKLEVGWTLKEYLPMKCDRRDESDLPTPEPQGPQPRISRMTCDHSVAIPLEHSLRVAQAQAQRTV